MPPLLPVPVPEERSVSWLRPDPGKGTAARVAAEVAKAIAVAFFPHSCCLLTGCCENRNGCWGKASLAKFACCGVAQLRASEK